MRALLSVADKTGIIALARTLVDVGWELTATSGTAALLAAERLPVVPISAWMGMPVLLDGRVKTLHHKVFLALLCQRDRPGQLAEAAAEGVEPVDLIAGGFYRFAADDGSGQACARPDLLQSIDIGGPAMMRAAAKNHRWVIPLADPADYGPVARLLAASGGDPGGVGPQVRRGLASKAFRILSELDGLVAATLSA